MNSLLPVILCAHLVQAEPVTPAVADEQLIKAAGIATDAEGLLSFFQQRTLSDLSRLKVSAWIDRLGHDDFNVREAASKELIALGPAVVPALTKAMDRSDPELVLRARQCLATLPKDVGVDTTSAAVRVLARLEAKGAAGVLIAFLPDAGYRSLEREIFAALPALCASGVDQATRQATLDKLPLRRSAAALCLAHSGRREDLPFLKALVKDKALEVRRRAIVALVRLGDHDAVAQLIELIGGDEAGLALEADELMQRIAGAACPVRALDGADADSRLLCRDVWRKWWQERGKTIDVAERLRGPARLGLTIIGETGLDDGGQVWECGPDGKPRWRIEARNPIAVQRLANGHILLADCCGEGFIKEYDADGKEVWSKTVHWPIGCQRLANGNTFIATQSSLQEVTPGGRVVFFQRVPKHIYSARKLANGHYVYLHSDGHIVELDARGENERVVPVGAVKGWGSVDLIGPDQFLLAHYGDNRVVEVDVEGRVLWEVKVTSPAWAIRLRNGNTLVASAEDRRVIEFDRAGKKVWEQVTKGKPFFASRR